MKYMKLGTRPDNFYTEEATRAVASDVPGDLVMKVNNIAYILHKYSLLPKCGLLQRLCSDSEDTSTMTSIDLHDVPGGGDSFELCAKFCYGIAIDVSAHNFVSVFCAAKFLQMTETVEKGNLVAKLEAFFNSCILLGWKDSLVMLQSTASLPEWSENLGIIRRCLDSVIEKILTPPSEVKWSFTYTRMGYRKKYQQSVPRDWWTEDISILNVDTFQCILTALRPTNLLPPQLIGEALHVYAYKWLPISWSSESSASQNEDAVEKNRRVLEMIVSLIPKGEGSVSIRFLIRLLSIANLLRVSPVTKAELVRLSSQQLEKATVNDLLLPICLSASQHTYDIDMIKVVVDSFLEQQKHQSHADGIHSLRSMRRVGKLIDTYLQTVAKDANIPVSKITSLAEALPGSARSIHDDLYNAITIYLQEHPDLTKAEKKLLCRTLDCQKLSPEVRAHVVKNEHLPLRTVVQVLFYEQEKDMRATGSKLQHQELVPRKPTPTNRDDKMRPGQGLDKKPIKERGMTTSPCLGGARGCHHQMMTSAAWRETTESRRGKEIEEDVSETRPHTKHTKHVRAKADRVHSASCMRGI